MDRVSSVLSSKLAPYTEHAYALLRIFAGSMFCFHGFQKIFGVFTESSAPFLSQMWIGGVIELVCGITIALGLCTTLAAFLASGQMAVAYFQFHWKFQFNSAFFPTINKGELAVLYCFVFLYIACKGSGMWSFKSCCRSKG